MFLGFEGTSFSIDQRARLSPFLAAHPQPLSGYTFATLAAWNDSFHYRWLFAEPELLISSYVLEPDPHRYLLQPIGVLSPAYTDQIVREGARLPYRLKIAGVSEAFLAANAEAVRHFDVVDERDAANYVYSAEDLATLVGKRFSPKRNLISQFERQYAWTVERVTPENTQACRDLLGLIAEEDPSTLALSRRWELAALVYTLDHYAELAQQGVLIRVEGRPVAFSLFERLNANTAVIHFERALRSYKGLYQIVNREAARVMVADGYERINREEDVGDPGLRKAKLSYNPIELTKSYSLLLRR
jgi:hypothetical protein